MTYQELTPDVLAELGAEIVPDQVIGFAAWDQGRVCAIVAAFVGADGRWMASVILAPGCSPSVHRQTVRVLQQMAAAGVPEIWARPDMSIPRAQAWMERLGFEPRDNGEWRLGLASGCRQSGRGRRRHRDVRLGAETGRFG